MAASFERDVKGEFPNFAKKSFTDRILDYLESILTMRISPTGIGKVIVSRGGFVIDLSALVAKLSPPPPLAPLNVYNASTATANFIGVVFGNFGQNAEATVGTSVPTISSTRLDNTTPPKLSVSTSTRLIYLHAAINSSGLITATTIVATASVDPPAATTTDYYMTLALLTWTGSGSTAVMGIGNSAGGSQSYELCAGSLHLVARV